MRKQEPIEYTPRHRMSVLENMGFFRIAVEIGQVLGFAAIGLGLYVFSSERPDRIEFSIAMFAIGTLAFLGAFFLSKWDKKRLAQKNN